MELRQPFSELPKFQISMSLLQHTQKNMNDAWSVCKMKCAFSMKKKLFMKRNAWIIMTHHPQGIAEQNPRGCFLDIHFCLAQVNDCGEKPTFVDNSPIISSCMVIWQKLCHVYSQKLFLKILMCTDKQTKTPKKLDIYYPYQTSLSFCSNHPTEFIFKSGLPEIHDLQRSLLVCR